MWPILFLYAISATTYTIGKWLLIHSTPIFLTGLRTCCAGLFFIWYAKAHNNIQTITRYIAPCLIVGFFSFYMSNALKFWALQYITSERASVIALVEPLCAVIFAYILCNERMNYMRWIGLSICLSGALISIAPQSFLLLDHLLPDCTLLVSVLFSSFGALYMRKLIRKNNCSISIILGISMTSAGFFSLITSAFLEQPLDKLVDAPLYDYALSLGAMILISNIIGYALYGNLVKRYSAVLISSASLLRPFFIACYDGNINTHVLFTTMIIAIGITFMYRAEKSAQATGKLTI